MVQDHIDSLPTVVLQNHRALDLMAQEKGMYLCLEERCCCYAGKSGVVRQTVYQL